LKLVPALSHCPPKEKVYDVFRYPVRSVPAYGPRTQSSPTPKPTQSKKVLPK
jgi:hypothetical protein